MSSSKIKVALLGGTGETGNSILEGLAADGSFEDITLLVRPASVHKPAVSRLAGRGFFILPIDTETTIDPGLLRPFEVVLSAIGPEGQLSQLNLATAAAAAGVKRFVPCGYITIAPPGVMLNRDQKEEVHNHIFRLHLPYTIIDTGFWHQLSFPRLSSGKLDGLHFYGSNVLYAGGTIPNLTTDLRDIGRWVATIIKDPRTINKRVVVWSDELSQLEMFELCGNMAGEKIEYSEIDAAGTENLLEAARKAYDETGRESAEMVMGGVRQKLWSTEYVYSKFVRGDNTLANAKYLGYLDARELYPDFRPIRFADYFQELLNGKIERPYKERTMKSLDNVKVEAPKI